MAASYPPQAGTPAAARRSGRPRSVTLLAVGVLSIAVLNLVRLMQAIEGWEFLQGLLPIPPLYLVVSGAIWALAGGILAVGLWLGMRWAPWGTLIGMAAYALYYWLDRLTLANHPGRSTNLPFVVIATILALAGAAWILSRKNVKTFFGAWHERTNEN